MNGTVSHRKRREQTRRAYIALALLLVLIIAALLLLFFPGQEIETERGDLLSYWGRSPKLNIAGKDYPFNHQISNVLIIGTDQEERTVGERETHRNNGQADFLLLLSIDNRSEIIHPLQIDRDTMAEIVVLSVLGKETGTQKAQICLAHGFGNTEEKSSMYTVRAVSDLLFSVPIEHVCTFSRNDFVRIVDFIGGIKVKLEEDYLDIDPQLRAGNEIIMDGNLAMKFVRARMNVEDGTNQSRMKRQRIFLKGLREGFRTYLQNNAGKAEQFNNVLMDNMFTSMGKGTIINIVDKALYYGLDTMKFLQGQHRIGEEGYTEMWPDSGYIQDLARNWFCLEP